MWDVDKQNYELEEKRLRDRINQINADNASFLKKQMATKESKAPTKMNKAEFALNKPLLKEANQKLRI